MDQTELLESLLHELARLVSTSPAGHGLVLMGGMRYRLLDRSHRLSTDADYHWTGDLDGKQDELVRLFKRRLLPEVMRRHGYEGSVAKATGPDAESPVVRQINLAFWQAGVPYSRIEIPVDITRIECSDPPIGRTVDGVFYLTATDADMIESKVLALVTRSTLQHRDMVDVYLFSDNLREDSPERLRAKLERLGASLEDAQALLEDLREHREFHARSVARIIETQVDAGTAGNMEIAGGGPMIVDQVTELLARVFVMEPGE